MTALLATLRAAIARTDAEERGATAVEYGLMVALIAVVIIGAVAGLGGTIRDSFTNTSNAIATPPVAATP